MYVLGLYYFYLQVQVRRKRSLGSLTPKSQALSQTLATEELLSHHQTSNFLSPSAFFDQKNLHQLFHVRPDHRRNSCAIIRYSSPLRQVQVSGSKEEELAPVGANEPPGGWRQDPEVLLEVDHRNNSWSATVGTSDSRSVDTGLNELCRITGIQILCDGALHLVNTVHSKEV